MIETLQKILDNNVYKNHSQFFNIIKKFIQKSMDLNNKSIELVSTLKEYENTKSQLKQKEIQLGLKEKPYGKLNLDEVINNVIVYKNIDIKNTIRDFKYILDNFFDEQNNDIKKEMIKSANENIKVLKSNGINPMSFIINPQRLKVWDILENEFEVTIKKIEADIFIEKIKTLKLKHFEAIEAIKNNNQEKENIQNKILKILNTKNYDPETIKNLEAKLNKELEIDISYLMIDTHNVMESLNELIPEIPNFLDADQLQELKEFLPAIDEYYKDQIYALSGGNAYTALAINLKDIQEIIDNGASAGKILEEVYKLNHTMQHLYILHWIAEYLLKKILNCFYNSCSLGRTIQMYNKQFNTKIDLKKIQQAVYFRNNIAHNGLIWKPQEITNAIENYTEYINNVSKEREFDLYKFYLKKMDRKLTQAQKEKRYIEFMQKKIDIDEKTISKELKTEIMELLEKNGWRLNKTSHIKDKIYDEFCHKHLELSFGEVKKYLIQSAKNRNIKLKENETIEQKAINMLIWCVYNQTKKPLETKKNIEKIKTYIESVSDKKYKKGLIDGIKRFFN